MDAVLFDVRPALAGRAVAAGCFSAVDLGGVAVDGDPEHVEAVEQVVEVGSPLGEFDDVLDDDVVAGGGQGGNAPVEAVEEAGPHLLDPGERSGGVAAARQETGLDQLVAAEQQERDAQGCFGLSLLEQVALAHRPPVVVEGPGPQVQTRLVGRPVVPVMNLVSRIQPTVRRRDVRIALVVHTLLHEPFVVPSLLTGVLQRPESEVVEVLDAAAECRVGDQPLLRP